MADFARVVAAVDQVLGTNGLSCYVAKEGALAADSLDGDDFVSAMTAAIPDVFMGTSAELLQLVTPTSRRWRPPKDWPGNARSVTQLLHRQAPVMRKADWVVDDDGGANERHTVRWALTPPEMVRIGHSSNSSTRHPGHEETSHTSTRCGQSQDELPLRDGGGEP